MPTTSKGLRYPSPTAAPNVSQDIQNLASDANTALPGDWVYQLRSNAYTHNPGASMATITSGSFSVVVPSGRTLDVEFKAPRLNLGTAADARVRLVMGGVVQEYQQHSPGSGSSYAPLRLTGSVVGSGASVTTTVEAQAVVAGVTIDSSAGAGPVTIRYRIV